MCTMPNTNTISDLTSYALVTNISTFKEENDLMSLSMFLDELFSGYLDSDFCKADPVPTLDRFRDYLKLKELITLVE